MTTLSDIVEPGIRVHLCRGKNSLGESVFSKQTEPKGIANKVSPRSVEAASKVLKDGTPELVRHYGYFYGYPAHSTFTQDYPLKMPKPPQVSKIEQNYVIPSNPAKLLILGRLVPPKQKVACSNQVGCTI